MESVKFGIMHPGKRSAKTIKGNMVLFIQFICYYIDTLISILEESP